MLMVVERATQKPLTEPHLVRVAGWTLERYLQEAPEDAFWEFVRGEVVMHSPVRIEHQDLTRFLTFLLHGFCLHYRCGRVYNGPAAVRVLPEVVREPDIFVLSLDDALQARGVLVEARPLLIVEVVSPSTRTLDLVEKAYDYAQAGIPEYWVVDREEQTFHQHVLEQGRYAVAVYRQGRVSSHVLPGFWLDVAWLWQEPLPSEWDVLERVLGREPAADRRLLTADCRPPTANRPFQEEVSHEIPDHWRARSPGRFH